MAGEGATAADKPKEHSPFVQVVFRRSGETADLAGKALLGFGGFKSVAQAHRWTDLDWPRLLVVISCGGLAIGVGIYLQAKAEET